jgi:nitrogen regulatory protein PII
MKLLIITAVSAFEKEIKQILKKAQVTSYSFKEVTGYKDISEDGIETNWFATEINETQSLLFYAFVKNGNVEILFDLISKFNEIQKTASKIHVAVMNIEKSN